MRQESRIVNQEFALNTIKESVSGIELKKKAVTLLLDTDKRIKGEKRVGIVPEDLRLIRSFLEDCGVTLHAYMVSGAGERVHEDPDNAFSDSTYEEAGAKIVNITDIAAIDNVDVVHALKEPASHEAFINKPFMRIGAAHLPARPEGVEDMLEVRNFCALFDGATIGSCSFKYLKNGLHDKNSYFETPIVNSMSILAGKLSAQEVIRRMKQLPDLPKKCVVVGAGVAGLSAIEQLAEIGLEALYIVDISATSLEHAVSYAESLNKFDKLYVAFDLSRSILLNAGGIIFSQRSGAKESPAMCTTEDIMRMPRGAAIADIAIDQGGSIIPLNEHFRKSTAIDRKSKQLPPKLREMSVFEKRHDAVGVDELITHIKTVLGENDYYLYAEENMPKHDPLRGSLLHSQAVTPYVASLLLAAAVFGGPEEATRRILGKDVLTKEESSDSTAFENYLQDLRNGLELAIFDDKVYVTLSDTAESESVKNWISEITGVDPDTTTYIRGRV